MDISNGVDISATRIRRYEKELKSRVNTRFSIQDNALETICIFIKNELDLLLKDDKRGNRIIEGKDVERVYAYTKSLDNYDHVIRSRNYCQLQHSTTEVSGHRSLHPLLYPNFLV